MGRPTGKHLARGSEADAVADRQRELQLEQDRKRQSQSGKAKGKEKAGKAVQDGPRAHPANPMPGQHLDKLGRAGGGDSAMSAGPPSPPGHSPGSQPLQQLCGPAGRVRGVHGPKSIDNDLDLPPFVDTFGYQTARHHGVEIVKNLMVDAKTTSRWYYVIAMGRKAGHLALGMGKAAGATITLIPEEFTQRPIRMRTLVDTLVGAHIKRLSSGRRDGVAVIAEGVVLAIDPADLAGFDEVERDAHGHVRIAEVNIGEILK